VKGGILSAKIVAVCISENKGERKQPVERGELLPYHGLAGDAHAGPWHRQISLLAQESVEKMRAAGLDVGPGAFAENITTSGIDLMSLKLGTRLRIGSALLEITQIGKECHSHCEIHRLTGDCVMPREGVFAVVIEGGMLKAGDGITVIEAE